MGNEVYNEALVIGMGVAAVVLWLAVVGLAVAGYVLRGIGLYDLARKREVRGTWLAWVPVAWLWVLGAIVDGFAAQRGIRRRWRWLMVILYGAIILCYVAMVAVMFITVFAMKGTGDMEAATLALMGGISVMYIPMALALMAFAAVLPVCYYKVFEETVPEKAVKYLLLSYLVPLAFGFCLMRCAKVSVPSTDNGAAESEGAGQEGEFIPQDPFALTGEKEEN